jgi:cytidine deaminase
MPFRTPSVALAALALAACGGDGGGGLSWSLDEASRELVSDPELERRMLRALDAAAATGTYPPISKYQVRTATVVEHGGKEHVVVGGNTEYHVPEAIHGESALLNHVTSLFGSDVTREKVRFVAYYAETCGESLSCGDCRDYQVEVTDAERLLAVCGEASTGKVQVRPFREALVPEESFPEVLPEAIPLPPETLERLVAQAREAREGGIDLFTARERHAGAAAISHSGAIYRAAGVDDAAFHYRYAIGGLLQQAATERDYFLQAIVVVGEPGAWPRVSYRERQYGYEFSSFNGKRGHPPIRLVLADGKGRYRLTTFEEALPYAFSTNDFMPGAVDAFLAPR